ncbi:MAG TPA: ribonuclease P protein component [Terriglobales bacterium]|nr:ribonuclease P protein component [Terriglobales bacterium]
MSIPREHRLRKHAEFELVYRSGRRHFSQILTAFYLSRAAENAAVRGPRVGITVGKALGKATARNRIKRRVRAAVTENLNRLTRDVDVVINPKKVTFEIEFTQLLGEIGRAFDVIQQKTTVSKSVPSAVADGS